MSVTPSAAASPLTVTINPGETASAPPSITGFGFNVATQALVVTFSDGSQQDIPGFAAAIAESLGGASLAVLDADGNLILGGKPRFGANAAGNLAIATPLPVQGVNGYNPVTGSGEFYINGSSVSEA